MTIDVVYRLEFLVELFEGRRRDPDSIAVEGSGAGGNWRSTPLAVAPRAQTLTLADMLAEAHTPLEAFSRTLLQHANEDMRQVVSRIARFLSDHAEMIEEDAPRSPRVLAYVYPIV